MSDIYTYLKENYNITDIDYQFKRDYIKNPLLNSSINGEQPNIEDLKYLYIDLNLSQTDLSKIFKKSRSRISSIIIEYNIIKDESKIRLSAEKTCLRKFGAKSNMCLKEFQNNSKQIRLEKYGNEYYNNREKSKQTCLSKYGKESYSKTEECKEKIKETNNRKYGVDWVVETKDFILKSKQTCLSKYGKESYSKTEECQNRIYQSKSKNRTHNGSKLESECFRLLSQRFKEVKTQYKSEKYPFPCDFYIPEIDTYIEYQGTWTHGREPYIGNDKQNIIVEKYRNKKSEYYNKAIETWTIRDPMKRKIAHANGIKLLEFFNMKQFKKWIENYIIL